MVPSWKVGGSWHLPRGTNEFRTLLFPLLERCDRDAILKRLTRTQHSRRHDRLQFDDEKTTQLHE